MKISCSIFSNAPRKNRASGWTLPELMVAAAIGGLIMAAVAATTVSSVRSFASIYNYANLDMASRTALDTVSKDIRNATNVVSASATSLVLAGPGNVVVTFFWDPSANTLTRARQSATGSTIQTTLSHCSDWKFKMYTKTRTVTTTPAACKMIAMNWKCSRKVIGMPQTDDAQEAVIILRNK